MIASTGYECQPSRLEFKGFGGVSLRDQGQEWTAFHLVDCREGTSYLVQIAADAEGSTTVLDCGIAAVVSADCRAEFD